MRVLHNFNPSMHELKVSTSQATMQWLILKLSLNSTFALHCSMYIQESYSGVNNCLVEYMLNAEFGLI